MLKFLSITCDPSEHSSFKKSLQSQTTLDGVLWSIKGHLISVLQDHMLTVTAKLDPYTGYLKVEEYISTSFQSATRGSKGIVPNGRTHPKFWWAEVFRKICKWLAGENYMVDFSKLLRAVPNFFFLRDPLLLRCSSCSKEEGTFITKLFIAEHSFYPDVLETQETYVAEAATEEDRSQLRSLLYSKVNLMERRNSQRGLVFQVKWKYLPSLLQDRLGNGFERREQYFEVKFVHNPIDRHTEKSGFAGRNEFFGAGRGIGHMNLEGSSNIVFIQDFSKSA